MSIRIPPAVMELLIALDKSRSEGQEWTSAVGRTFDFDVRFWAISRTLVETNTIDGEAPVFRITEDGMRAMTHGELQDRPPAIPSPPPVKLKSSTEYLLTKLAEALDDGDGWVFSKAIDINTVPYHMRQAAFNKGYIERRGTTSKTEFRITPVGLSVIGIAAATGAPAPVETARTSRLSDADKQRMIDESRARLQAAKVAAPKPAVPFEELIRTANLSESEKRHMLTGDMQPAKDELPLRFYEQLGIEPPAHRTAAKPDECAEGGCNECLYRNVVEMLAKRVPGVRELVNGLKTIHGQK